MFTHSEVLKICSKRLSQNNYQELRTHNNRLKMMLIIMLSSEYLVFGKALNNKALHRRLIKGHLKNIQNHNEVASKSTPG